MASSAKRARRGGLNIGLFGDDIVRLGDPFGKELTLFNLDSLCEEGNGAIQAKFIKSFGEYKMPMGVEAMSEEVIVCNMNNGTVEFTDFDGNTNLTLPTGQGRGPKKFREPSVATILLDCRILVGDKAGCHVFSGTGEFIKTVCPKQLSAGGSLYGILPIRSNNGSVILVVESNNGEKYQYVYYDQQMTRIIKVVDVKLEGEGKHAIRFTACLGNTILLSDMNKIHQGIHVTDLEGHVRHKIGTKQSDDKGNFIQAAGVCFDNAGNFLAICSKTSRISAFRSDGTLMCDVQFPEGAIQRPSDLSVNDDGKMAVVSLTGQVFMFDLLPGNPKEDWPTRGPRPAGGYGFRGGRGGRGRGGPRGGGRGTRGRGGRGNFRARY